MKAKFGFIYLWFDTKRKKFYLGSHLGSLTDGYIGSNNKLLAKYKSRPETFKRKILESHKNITSKQLLQREQYWLNMIKHNELNVRYYNEKNVASGGDIVSYLSEEKRKQHAEKSGLASKQYWNNISPEEYENRRKTAFGGNKFDRSYLKERNVKLCSKRAKIILPDGEEIVVLNISKFCQENKLNYGNFKTMLRKGRGSCQGIKGIYI
jgi:hypothetical protein